MDTDNAATVIIGQSVRPGSEKEFLRWQHELNNIASRYPGFIGAEITTPAAVQPDWIVVYARPPTSRHGSTAPLARTASQSVSSTSKARPPSRFSVVPQNPPMSS